MATTRPRTHRPAPDLQPVAPSAAAQPTLREHLATSRVLGLVISLAIFAIFLPALIVPYAFSDDYPILFIADGLGSSPWFGKSVANTVAASGRPFAGLLDQWFFSAAGTIDNLRFVRLVAVIGIALLALLLHWALVRARIKPSFAAVVAVLVCSVPAFQVYGSWAVLFNVPYAALLGGAASMLTVAAVDAPRDLKVDRTVGAVGLLLGGLLIYQPGAMFFWVFLAVALVGALQDSPRAVRLARAHVGVAVIAFALAFVVVRIAVHIVGNAAPNPERNALTNDPIGKLRWFFHGPLYWSLSLTRLTPSAWITALVVAVIGIGILLGLWRQRARPLLMYVLFALALVPLSFMTNLAVREDSPTYRVLGALSGLIVLYVCLGALGIWLAVRTWLRPRLTRRAILLADRCALAASVAFAVIAAVIAARNVTTLFVVPQNTELRMIRNQVAALPTGAPRVVFVETADFQSMAHFVGVDEYGVPSSARPWSIEPLVILILREEGRLPPDGQRPAVDTLPWNTTTLPANEPVIDVRSIQRLR